VVGVAEHEAGAEQQAHRLGQGEAEWLQPELAADQPAAALLVEGNAEVVLQRAEVALGLALADAHPLA